MANCKHQNGQLEEHVSACHIRDVEDGVLEKIGDNVLDNISFYFYICDDCGRKWRFNGTPRQKWLAAIYNQLFAS